MNSPNRSRGTFQSDDNFRTGEQSMNNDNSGAKNITVDPNATEETENREANNGCSRGPTEYCISDRSQHVE